MDHVSVQQEIEIKRAWAPAFPANSTTGLLDREQFVEEGVRRERRCEPDDGIEIGLLAGWAEGRGFEDHRAGDQARAGQRGQGGEGGFEVSAAIAQIGTEGDVGGGLGKMGHGGSWRGGRARSSRY